MSDGEQADDAQKTEDPTAKRLQEAREKGQVPLSREVNNWIMLFFATVLIVNFGDSFMGSLQQNLKAYLEQAHMLPADIAGIGSVLGNAFWDILRLMTLPLLTLMTAAFIGPFVQVGPLWALKAIKPDFSKISPVKGFGRLFSLRSLVEFAKGIFKISVVGLIGTIILYPFFNGVEHLIGSEISVVMDEMQGLFTSMMIGILIVLLIIAAVDLVYQRMQNMKQLRMTKQEVKDEYKQSEGDPHVKGRLRQLRVERARQRMMQAVPQADVVITNPTHYSIALKYDPDEMEAPLCVAKGVDEVALRIREVAKEHDVLLYENVPLARALFDTVEIDETIPATHYKAVAEVISYVFKMRGNLK